MWNIIIYVWNPATYNCENGKYLASIMDDSVITCDEVLKSYDEEIKTIPITFNEKSITCKIQTTYHPRMLKYKPHILLFWWYYQYKRIWSK